MDHSRTKALARKTAAGIATLLLLTALQTPVQAAPAQETKVRLQSHLQKHIYRSLVNGAFHTLDPETGQVLPLYPLIAHPQIFQMGEYYVMCADFRDSQGNAVDVDFYLLKKPKGYQVFRAEIDNHNLLDGMLKSGKVKPLR